MPERWTLHTVVLDLDDTLFPEADFVRSGFRAVDRWLVEQEGVRGFATVAERHFAAGLRGKIFDAALTELGMPCEPERVARLVEVYREHAPELSLETQVVELLDWLSPRFNLAVLTDGYAAVQRRKFEALGLRRWVDCLIVTDEIGRDFWKPHPAGFERIMARFGGEPAGYVYVADNPRKDFIAPKQLGWRTVRFRQEGREHSGYVSNARESADCEIRVLAELESLLAPQKRLHQS